VKGAPGRRIAENVRSFSVHSGHGLTEAVLLASVVFQNPFENQSTKTLYGERVMVRRRRSAEWALAGARPSGQHTKCTTKGSQEPLVQYPHPHRDRTADMESTPVR
jgi:hypothetical protein